ncbi:MAG TPA: long-chain fatty acid--CoA ligase [Pseudobdellovibrionaceae bacterium]|nr:long-chain fatty acid--CoA ligase [Pseudobdellovibrionaceae bacterium]
MDQHKNEHQSEIHSITQVLLKRIAKDAHQPCLQYKESREWKTLTWSEYFNRIQQLSHGLQSLGIKSGDRVAIMSNSRFEWACLDLALLGMGAVVVPIYQNSTAEDLQFILNDSKARILVCENRSPLKIWHSVEKECPNVEKIIVIDSSMAEVGQLSFNELLALGETHLQGREEEFTKLCEQVKLDQTATIVYTSGTTGTPKGVVLTHQQIISEVSEAYPLFGVSSEDQNLTFLPFAHILGRIEIWAHIYIGYQMAFAESIDALRVNLKEIRPTFVISVPRIFEKIHAAVVAQAESKKVRKKIFEWALSVGRKVAGYRETHQAIPITLLGEWEIARRLVINKVVEAFGGRLRFAISGGAPLSKELSEFFYSCGVLILEGYGLTETTAAIFVNTPYHYKFGTVGIPVGDVKARIAEDGEILIKSKKVMKEYYNQPSETERVLKDGWFATGDIGEITEQGELRITDRKKDLIKTAGGKYVAPQRLESLLKIHPLINQVLIHGDQKKYIVALLTLDKTLVEQLGKDRQLHYRVWTDLLEQQPIQDEVRKIVAHANSQLASFETIKKYLVLPTEFTIESGELTPSLKVKRKYLDKKYTKEIESLYP